VNSYCKIAVTLIDSASESSMNAVGDYTNDSFPTIQVKLRAADRTGE
jgi:hypothetical protein